jgi:nicotinamidase-related amidase
MKKTLILILAAAFIGGGTFAQDEGKTDFSPALLVIDMQNKYLPMMSQEDQEAVIKMVNLAIWVFRQHELPVIRIYHISEKWGPEPGTEDFEFDESINIEESDPKIIKTYGSAFNKTGLDSLLRAEGINTLYMCGLSAVGCVLATYFDSGNYEYTSFLIKDSMLSNNALYTDQIEGIFDAVDINTVNFMLKIGKE